MKKIFFYNFIPTKAEEEEANANIKPFTPTGLAIEIRDLNPPDPDSPWQIRRQLTTADVINGKLLLSRNETVDHVFRYWTTEMVNYVVMGNKTPVVVWDVTEEYNPVRYRNESIFLEKGCSDEFYVLGLIDLICNRLINPGDEIGLFWDMRMGSFQFKLLHRDI